MFRDLTEDQNADRPALRRDRGHAVLGGACQGSVGAADGKQAEGLLASGQITMRKVDGWQSLAEKPTEQTMVDLAA